LNIEKNNNNDKCFKIRLALPIDQRLMEKDLCIRLQRLETHKHVTEFWKRDFAGTSSSNGIGQRIYKGLFHRDLCSSLLLYSLLLLAILLFLTSKTSWLISEMIFSNSQGLMHMAADNPVGLWIANVLLFLTSKTSWLISEMIFSNSQGLMHMPVGLWIANEKPWWLRIQQDCG